MMKNQLYEKISGKGSDKEGIADEAIQNPEWIQPLLEGLSASQANIKYGCEKILRIMSEKNPALLYPHFDFFVQMMDWENNFLKWGAIMTVANLTVVDAQNKFDKIFDKYFSPISGPVMITAGNIIGSAAKIARVKPHLTQKIIHEILRVEKAHYQTDECLNIACGHAIDSFSKFYDVIEDKNEVNKFITKQLLNTRVAVRKRAEKFFKLHSEL
jgi:hypothetical protein